MKTVLEHYSKMHSKDRYPYQCQYCNETFIFIEEVYIHELEDHCDHQDNMGVQPKINKCELSISLKKLGSYCKSFNARLF